MKRLILTSQSGVRLMRSNLAEFLIPFSGFRFVWGLLPSVDELASYLGPGSGEHGGGTHWPDYVSWPRDLGAPKHVGFIEFCQLFDTVELWFDRYPNDQLLLIWLLDYLRGYPDLLPRLKLRLVSFDFASIPLEGLGKWQVLPVDITENELETASMCWRAYRAPTPQACVELRGRDLSALPLLSPALLDLLDELPFRATGLGATEMRLLELIATGYFHTNALLYLKSLRQRRVFNEFELGYLIEGLAHGPRPAIAGLDDELRTLDRENYPARGDAFRRSELSLTEFGKAILAHREDFSRHNPIHRWWGGTELTSDRLWRWDPVLIAP
jgi:hypothetical protein